MSRAVWRFPLLPMGGTTTLWMPAGAVPCAVTGSPEGLSLHAVVVPSAPATQRTFQVVATGQPVGDLGPHVGSFQDGLFTWHVFEVPA